MAGLVYLTRLVGFAGMAGLVRMGKLVVLFMLSKTILISYFIMLNPLLPLMAIFLHPGMRLPFVSLSYFRSSLMLEPGLIVPMPIAVPGVPV